MRFDPLLLLQLYVAGAWTIRLVMLVVVTKRRRPASAMAWLLVIFFQPWIGLLAYLLIGRQKPLHWRLRKHEDLRAKAAGLRERFMAHPNVFHLEMGEAGARRLPARLSEAQPAGS